MDIPRTDASLFDMPLLSWRPFVSGREIVPMFRDSSGHHISLNTWTIADNGVVTPSIECLNDNCGFHEFVRLFDWTPGVASCHVPGGKVRIVVKLEPD